MKKLITLLLCINLFVGLLWLGNLAFQKYRGGQEENRSVALAAAAYDKDKLLSKTDYVRFDTLAKSVVRTKRISDADFAWMMRIIEPSFQSSDYRMPLVRSKAMSCFLDAKVLTPSQKEVAFRHVCRLAQTTGSGSSELDKIGAISLAYKLKDRRTIPYLLPLVNHKKRLVRSKARGVLESFGIDTKPLITEPSK